MLINNDTLYARKKGREGRFGKNDTLCLRVVSASMKAGNPSIHNSGLATRHSSAERNGIHDLKVYFKIDR